MKDFPAMWFRLSETGDLVGREFKSTEELGAAGEGWCDHPSKAQRIAKDAQRVAKFGELVEGFSHNLSDAPENLTEIVNEWVRGESPQSTPPEPVAQSENGDSTADDQAGLPPSPGPREVRGTGRGRRGKRAQPS